VQFGQRTSFRSLTLAGTAATFVIAMVVAACSRGGAPSSIAQAHPAVPVLAAKAERITVPQELHAIGTVQAYSTVEVKAQIGGEIVGVQFHEGQEVNKGQLLFTIDPRPFEAALEQAKANLAKTVAQNAMAEADARRWVTMYKVHAASSQQYDQANATAAEFQASVAADRAAVKTAELNLEYTRITSPVDGRAGKLNLNIGNIVKANADSAMVVLNQIKPIYVQFAMPERDLPDIRRHLETDNSLTVLANPPNQTDQPSAGTLSFIDNRDHPVQRTVSQPR
jgi:membrane fusion protein, multidrug efflux system